MAFIRCGTSGGGGGTSIDLLNPDVQYNDSNYSSGATVNIAVTQKPRYIVMSQWAQASGYGGYLCVYDVENDTKKVKGWWSSSSHDWQTYNMSDLILTCTDTTVTLTITFFSTRSRIYVNIYY